MIVDKHAVAALAGAVALFAGGTSALADTGGTGTQRCDQLLAKIAEKRGVSPDELRANLEARLLARIDGAENAGKISARQAARLRQRLADGSLCRAGKRVRAHVAVRGMMVAAAEFLGLDREQLGTQLPGTSLAGLARNQGTGVDALKAAMVAPAKERLLEGVAAGKISQARADAALARLQALGGKLAESVPGDVASPNPAPRDEGPHGPSSVLRGFSQDSQTRLRYVRFHGWCPPPSGGPACPPSEGPRCRAFGTSGARQSSLRRVRRPPAARRHDPSAPT